MVTSVDIWIFAKHLSASLPAMSEFCCLNCSYLDFTVAQVLPCIHGTEHKNCRAPFFIPTEAADNSADSRFELELPRSAQSNTVLPLTAQPSAQLSAPCCLLPCTLIPA